MKALIAANADERDPGNGPFYTFEVDGKEYRHDEPSITGSEIMDLADISRSDGLVQLLDDGTQRTVAEDEVIELKPGRRFKKRPRFKRG